MKSIGAYLALVILGIAWWLLPPPSPPAQVGQVRDSWQGVTIHNNGPLVQDTYGKSLAEDGYVYGWKYQCVEFIKRYYDLRYHHRMPDGQGNALDLWSKTVPDGGLNRSRGLIQFNVPSTYQPKADDILIYHFPPHGHVSLVMRVSGDTVFTLQQNVPESTRDTLFILNLSSKNRLSDPRIVGWLRHPSNHGF